MSYRAGIALLFLSLASIPGRDSLAAEPNIATKKPRKTEKPMKDCAPEKLVMPTAEPNGFVPTLNGQGYMTSTLDPVSLAFVDHARATKGAFMDIGAAYGVASIAALATGAKVIANDLDARHLEILKDRTPEADRSRLTLLPGRFPEDLKVEPNSLDGILIARVLHFFKGPDAIEAVKKAITWLKPGGIIYIVVESPHLKNFTSFFPEYEANKKAGKDWPGFIEDVKKHAPNRGKNLPPFIHFYDIESMTKVLVEAGYKNIQVRFLNRTDFPEDLRKDGRESVGATAEKPR